jgi:hypothetical protein
VGALIRLLLGGLVLLSCGPVPADGPTPREACDALARDADTDVDARRALGVCYLLGRGRLVDHAKALALFESAAGDGSADARFALAAALLFKVEDRTRDPEAVATLQQLIADGDERAHFPLAVAYTAALGVDADPARATAHFAAAVDAGDDVAAWVLAVSHRYGLLGLEPSPAQAWRAVARYLSILDDRYPELTMTASTFRDAVLGLHHDRLLRRYVFSDRQLELFVRLADEVIAEEDLSRLRQGWAGEPP